MNAPPQKVHPTGLLADAAREVWGPETTKRGIPEGPWRAGQDTTVFGPAYTIRISRSLGENKDGLDQWFDAFDNVPAGTVVVVEVAGDVGGAVVGDACVTRVHVQGALGLVVDGAVKDYSGILGVGLPTWVREARVEGTRSYFNVVEAGIDISLGGSPVSPGDYISADLDGVLVIPASGVERVLEITERMSIAEEKMFELIKGGEPIGEVYKKTGRA